MTGSLHCNDRAMRAKSGSFFCGHRLSCGGKFCGTCSRWAEIGLDLMFSLQTLVHFLENPWYKYGFLSLCATAISLIVKLCSRRKTEVTREDWAVGFDLAQVAIFAI